MYVLDKAQVDYILNDIRRNGIETEELQFNLLDHICCVVENEMSPDTSFEAVYAEVLPRFFKHQLREIQEETNLLLTFKNYYAMKKVMINSGLFTAVTFTVGSILKLAHLPGAAVLLILGIASMSFVFLPLFFLLKSKEEKVKSAKVILGTGVVFGILFCLSTLFKVMHWPYADVMWFIALGILFFVFLPLFYFTGIRKPETKMNTILASIMILTVGGLLFTLTNLRSNLNKESAYTASNAYYEKCLDKTELSNSKKYELPKVDSIQVKNEALKREVEAIINNINGVKHGFLTYMSAGKKISELELCKRFEGDFEGVALYFFKQTKMNPEEDILKSHLPNLKSALEKFKVFVGRNYSKDVASILNLEGGSRRYKTGVKHVSWEYLYFNAVPFEVAVRNLNQLQLAIRIIESSCVQ
jgi:hypothetical protein